jgi:hypothetical protein
MPRKRKGPGAGGRWAFCEPTNVYPILPSPESKGNCYFRELAFAHREAVTSDDPRVTRLGLEVLWHGVREVASYYAALEAIERFLAGGTR